MFPLPRPELDRSVVARGVLAGVAGTSVVSGLAAVERRQLGRHLVSEPPAMAGRLARRLLGRRLSRRQRQLAGMLMRWPYGVAWGTATAALAPDGVPPPVVGLAAGVAIWAFELVALPASGATPPVRAWRAGEIGVNLLNATAFGLAAAEVLSRTSAGRSSRRPR